MHVSSDADALKITLSLSRDLDSEFSWLISLEQKQQMFIIEQD